MDILHLCLNSKMSSNESSSNYSNNKESSDRQDKSSVVNSDSEMESVLTDVGQSLEELRTRYLQVKQDWQRYSELVNHKEKLGQTKANNFEKEPIKTELRDIEQQISELEIKLESVLLPDLFWQAIRFGGLGIAIGWLLKTLAS